MIRYVISSLDDLRWVGRIENGTIYLPPGIYHFTTTIDISDLAAPGDVPSDNPESE